MIRNRSSYDLVMARCSDLKVHVVILKSKKINQTFEKCD